jgi:hypothetical protein
MLQHRESSFLVVIPNRRHFAGEESVVLGGLQQSKLVQDKLGRNKRVPHPRRVFCDRVGGVI